MATSATYLPFNLLKPVPNPPPTSVLVATATRCGVFTYMPTGVQEVRTLELLVRLVVPCEEGAERAPIAGVELRGDRGLQWACVASDQVYVYACPLPPCKERDRAGSGGIPEEQEPAEPPPAEPEPQELLVPLYTIALPEQQCRCLEVGEHGVGLLLWAQDAPTVRLYALSSDDLHWPWTGLESAAEGRFELPALASACLGAVEQPAASKPPRTLRSWELPSNPSCVGVATKGRCFAVGGHDGLVSLFSSNTMALQWNLSAHYDAVVALTFSAAGTEVVSWSQDGYFYVHELATGSLLLRSRLVEPSAVCPILDATASPLPIAIGCDQRGQLRFVDTTHYTKLAKRPAEASKALAGWRPVRLLAGRSAVLVLAQNGDQFAVWTYQYSQLMFDLWPELKQKGLSKNDLPKLYESLPRKDSKRRVESPHLEGPHRLTAAALEEKRRAEESSMTGGRSGATPAELPGTTKAWYEYSTWKTAPQAHMKFILGDRNSRNARIARRIEALKAGQD